MSQNAKPSRRHHYIPQFYLGRFTPTGDKEDNLWVLDKETGKSWPSRPAQVAFEKDFYRIEAQRVEPDLLEKEFAVLESRAASALAEVIRMQRIPDGEPFSDLLHFVAMMVVRVPVKRRNIAEPMEPVAKRLLGSTLETPERWESTLSKMRRAGVEVNEKVSYEAMRRFVDQGAYRVKTHQNLLLASLLQMSATILELLPTRQWSLIIAPPEAGEFVCTDNPVLLTWIESPPTPVFSPGFGMTGTEVNIPLTRHLALRGRFEEGSNIFTATPELVGAVNHQAAIFADRFIYSSKEDFPCIQDGKVISGRRFLDILRQDSARVN